MPQLGLCRSRHWTVNWGVLYVFQIYIEMQHVSITCITTLPNLTCSSSVASSSACSLGKPAVVWEITNSSEAASSVTPTSSLSAPGAAPCPAARCLTAVHRACRNCQHGAEGSCAATSLSTAHAPRAAGLPAGKPAVIHSSATHASKDGCCEECTVPGKNVGGLI